MMSAILTRVHFAGRAAGDGEVLAGQVDEPPVDRRCAGDDAVGWHVLVCHAEVSVAGAGEQADLLEAPGIDQRRDALAGGQLAGLLLLLELVGAAAELTATLLAALPQVSPPLFLHRLCQP